MTLHRSPHAVLDRVTGQTEIEEQTTGTLRVGLHHTRAGGFVAGFWSGFSACVTMHDMTGGQSTMHQQATNLPEAIEFETHDKWNANNWMNGNGGDGWMIDYQVYHWSILRIYLGVILFPLFTINAVTNFPR